MIDSIKMVDFIKKVATVLCLLIPVTILVAPLPPFSPIVGLFFFPYISAKTFIFRILVDVALLLVIILGFLDKKYRPSWSWVAIAGLVFVAIISIADFV